MTINYAFNYTIFTAPFLLHITNKRTNQIISLLLTSSHDFRKVKSTEIDRHTSGGKTWKYLPKKFSDGEEK